MMSLEDFQEELSYLLNPEPDGDGFFPHEYPDPRLREVHGLDFEYLDGGFTWEGATNHPYTRLCPERDDTIRLLTRNQDVPERLFEAALRLFGDSIVEYHDKTERSGGLRYYPSVILTFWSGFETFVRHKSELMVATVRNVPDTVANFLREREYIVDGRGRGKIGNIKERSRFQPVLDRYAVLLAHGYKWQVDRGNRFWQGLEAARKLRDYYTHLDVKEPRAISSNEVLEFIEAVILAIIWPSSVLRRTLLLGIYRVYTLWELMYRFNIDYREKPFFLDWHLDDRYQFHCNFEDVDSDSFPNAHDKNFFSRQENED
jgi:hypothetical protein